MKLAEVQARLAQANLYGGAIDGRYGLRTARAIDALFLARPYLAPGAAAWSAPRRVLAAAQLFCMLDGIEVGPIDGLLGPQTRHAFEVYAARKRGIDGVENWRDSTDADAPRTSLDDASAKTSARWPAQRDMLKFFGPVGAHQATLEVPAGYPLHLAWDPKSRVARFSCHEKVHDAVRRVLGRVLDHYGPARIRALGLDRFGGCLSVRRMRGGTAWSTHAWGAALDFDPERNQLQWNSARAAFAKPEYERWWALWEEEEFLSLGRARDFDWMHVQAARL